MNHLFIRKRDDCMSPVHPLPLSAAAIEPLQLAAATRNGGREAAE